MMTSLHYWIRRVNINGRCLQWTFQNQNGLEQVKKCRYFMALHHISYWLIHMLTCVLWTFHALSTSEVHVLCDIIWFYFSLKCSDLKISRFIKILIFKNKKVKNKTRKILRILTNAKLIVHERSCFGRAWAQRQR